MTLLRWPRPFDTTYWRDRAKAAQGIAAELGKDEPSPIEGMLAACDAIDALSARLAALEAERDAAYVAGWEAAMRQENPPEAR